MIVLLLVTIILANGDRVSFSTEEPSMRWCLTVEVKERAAAAAALFTDIESIDLACEMRAKP